VSERGVESREPIQAELARISRRVREGRKREGLTLQELAERCGLATSTIQKVETEQMIPSVAVLLKLARGLRRRPADLIHDGGDLAEAVLVRGNELQPVGAPGAMTAERLSGDLYGSALETWRITLHPGVSSGGSIRYEGEELVVCEEGSVTFRVGDAEYELGAGDTLHFRASIPHSWSNQGEGPARFMLTGTLPAAFRAVMQGRLRSLAGGV
jgi:transcriptional regulator with XRE-family HTH domain